jgi:hypothetical protein
VHERTWIGTEGAEWGVGEDDGQGWIAGDVEGMSEEESWHISGPRAHGARQEGIGRRHIGHDEGNISRTWGTVAPACVPRPA